MSVFPTSEYRARLARAQAAMKAKGFAALLLTTEPEIRYFTGYLTRFWESPTRLWFVVVPVTGDPVAVIPSIGAPLMARTWINDIRTWASPDPGNDGIALLSDTLFDLAPEGPVAMPSGPETGVRMPLDLLDKLKTLAPPLVYDGGLVSGLRAIKSNAEIGKIRAACTIANHAFARVGEISRPGISMAQVFRRFQMLALEEGADWVPYLAGGAGPRGYSDVISPASDDLLNAGDVLMLDTGLVKGGYFCDFNRNFAIGEIAQDLQEKHKLLVEATFRAFELAAPGATAADLWAVMDVTLHTGATGRMGHGLGMQLTEGLSLIPDDHTVLEPGMVLTLEPFAATGPDTLLVHEENIVITETGAEWLSDPAATEMPIL